MASPSSPVTAYIDGGIYIFESDVDIPGGSTTLNISGVGAVSIETHLTTNPSNNDLVADTLYELIYNAANDTFFLSSFVFSELSARNLEGLIEGPSGMIEAPTAKTYVLTQSARYPFTIDSIFVQTASGTLTLDVQIDGMSITGLDLISVSSTPSSETASGGNLVIAGNRITMIVSGESSPVDLSWTFKTVRVGT